MFVALVDDNRVEIESLMRKSNGRLPELAPSCRLVAVDTGSVDRRRCGNKMLPACRPRRRHISFRPIIIETGRVKAELVNPDIVETEP